MMALQKKIRGLKAAQCNNPLGPKSLTDFQKLNPHIIPQGQWILQRQTVLAVGDREALTHIGIKRETQVTSATYMLRDRAYE